MRWYITRSATVPVLNRPTTGLFRATGSWLQRGAYRPSTSSTCWSSPPTSSRCRVSVSIRSATHAPAKTLHGRPRDDGRGFTAFRPRTGTWIGAIPAMLFLGVVMTAVPLHFENAPGARISALALRRTGPGAFGRLVRTGDGFHERRQHVLDGASHESDSRLGHPFRHLGLVADRGRSRDGGRAAPGDLQRGPAIRADLAGGAAHPHGRASGNRRLGWHAGTHLRALSGPGLHASVEQAGLVRRQSHGDTLDRHRAGTRLRRLVLRSGPAGVGRAGADRVFHERDGRQRQRLRHGMDLRHLPAAGPPARLHR